MGPYAMDEWQGNCIDQGCSREKRNLREHELVGSVSQQRRMTVNSSILVSNEGEALNHRRKLYPTYEQGGGPG